MQNVVETHETSSVLFEFAAGFEGVSVVTVSNSAEAELLVTATSPTAMAAARSTEDNRRRAGVREFFSSSDIYAFQTVTARMPTKDKGGQGV